MTSASPSVVTALRHECRRRHLSPNAGSRRRYGVPVADLSERQAAELLAVVEAMPVPAATSQNDTLTRDRARENTQDTPGFVDGAAPAGAAMGQTETLARDRAREAGPPEPTANRQRTDSGAAGPCRARRPGKPATAGQLGYLRRLVRECDTFDLLATCRRWWSCDLAELTAPEASALIDELRQAEALAVCYPADFSRDVDPGDEPGW